jgi:phosphohistidine phosphatase
MADFDRPLNERGVKEAEWAAGELARHGTRPDLVLCSPARRTRETLSALAGWLNDTPVTFERGIYEATAQSLLVLLHERSDSSILMIGHNPGFEDFARALVGDGDAGAIRRLARKYPPAGMATLTFSADHWSDVGAGDGRLAWFETPDE